MLSTKSVGLLSDQQLRAALKEAGISPGPITDSTRELYRKKLLSVMQKNQADRLIEEGSNHDLDSADESSDEPFEVDEEELNESSDSFSEEVEEESDLDDIKDVDTTQPKKSESKFYIIVFVSVVVIAAWVHLYSNSNVKFYKNLTKLLLILATLSPAGFIIYKIYRYYTTQRNAENERVCKLVNEALELLQSPENPKGLMPILHIRDTLLTPAERNAKKTIKMWQKAVKFVEDHESRVKVELVNIDGEDFRAWKWIGSKFSN